MAIGELLIGGAILFAIVIAGVFVLGMLYGLYQGVIAPLRKNNRQEWQRRNDDRDNE